MASRFQTLRIELKGDSDIDAMNENRNLLSSRQRPKLWRMLLIAGATTLLLVFISLVTLASLGFIYQRHVESPMPCNSTVYNVCLTPGCVKAASDLLSNLDDKVDPCDDFYRFACGGWLDRHFIPEDKPSVTLFTETQTDLYQQLRVLLEKEPNWLEPRYIKMVHEMYNICMDLDRIENLGAEPLKKDLKILGGWPVVEGIKWNALTFDWIQTVLSLRKLGHHHEIFLSTYVSINTRNNTVHSIGLGEAVLGMPDRHYYQNGLNGTEAAAYFNLMLKSAKLLGADNATVEEEMLKVFHFETALANFTSTTEERRNFTEQYNIYTVGELKHMIPQIPWLKYFKGLIGEEISENEILIISFPDFVNNFADLIAETEQRVIANYMLWKVVFQSMPHLSKEWRYMFQEFYSTVSGTKTEPTRWKQCLGSVAGSLDKALSSYYIQNYFEEDKRNAALEMFNYIHREFLRTLDGIDWMDEETKVKAEAKAKSIIRYIGYPEELLNKTALLEFYENLTISNESYFDNIKRIHKWSVDYSFSKLRKPNIRGEWKKFTRAINVNAYYQAQENGIEFLAGILRNPFFNKERPHYMNFGTAGLILGHEITHGFDDVGRQFNKDGNMMNWWDKSTEEKFQAKVQCIIDQYSNYTAENGMKLNGHSTQGENIADIGGLKIVYKAYLSWVQDNRPELKLPGLNYNPIQMFLISAANTWCGKFQPEALKLRITTGTHPPLRFRVLGMMSNFEEFSKEFNCMPNSPMNPKNKCHVW